MTSRGTPQRRWSAWEDELLTKMYEGGESMEAICEAIGRAPYAVSYRAKTVLHVRRPEWFLQQSRRNAGVEGAKSLAVVNARRKAEAEQRNSGRAWGSSFGAGVTDLEAVWREGMRS